MKRIDVTVQNREKTGKGAARSARRAGRVPAVVYGGDKEPQAISVDRLTMEKALHSGGESESILVNLALEGSSEQTLTLVRATQHDPLIGTLEHVDFLRVSTDKPITTTVPIHIVGTPAGVRAGGVFEQVLRELEIQCLPLNIPNAVELEVRHLEINQSLHVSDIPPSEDYVILTSPDRGIATVTAPKVGAAAGTEETGGAEAAAAQEAGA
ncbi:MAG: 50S ribosomal protein L25 [bacterium]|jgi:large subunit ribosomal protein L25